MRLIPAPPSRSGPAFSRFHHEVACRTAGNFVWTFLMPLAFLLLLVGRADFQSATVLARWLVFCAVAYLAVYGGVYALSLVAPFFGTSTVEAGSRAMEATADPAFSWRVMVSFTIRPIRLRPLLPARLTIAADLALRLRSMLPALRARSVLASLPTLNTAAPFRLFPFAPLRLPWLLS